MVFEYDDSKSLCVHVVFEVSNYFPPTVCNTTATTTTTTTVAAAATTTTTRDRGGQGGWGTSAAWSRQRLASRSGEVLPSALNALGILSW